MTDNQENRAFSPNPNVFWLRYLALERSLIEISDFIAICEDNLSTYSFKNMHLFIAICTELESVFNAISKNVRGKQFWGIKGNMVMMLDYFGIVENTEVVLNITGDDVMSLPFQLMFINHRNNRDYENGILDTKPKPHHTWWKQYIDLKHGNHDNFKNANLDGVLASLSALHILNLIYIISLENKKVKIYDEVLVNIPVNYTNLSIKLKGSRIMRRVGGGDYYVSMLNNKDAIDEYIQKNTPI